LSHGVRELPKNVEGDFKENNHEQFQEDADSELEQNAEREFKQSIHNESEVDGERASTKGTDVFLRRPRMANSRMMLTRH
jgi:hypothetical protein